MAVDLDAEQAALARRRCDGRASVLRADLRRLPFADGVFDVVTALASFHHAPFEVSASEARRVLKPGGRLVVLGVWTDNGFRDVGPNVLSSLYNRYLLRRRGPDAMRSPATLVQTGWHAARAQMAELLPGARLRRRMLWRYTLVWDKP